VVIFSFFLDGLIFDVLGSRVFGSGVGGSQLAWREWVGFRGYGVCHLCFGERIAGCSLVKRCLFLGCVVWWGVCFDMVLRVWFSGWG